ncbi:TPA: hypothetical protein ACWZSL_001874 [Streptococcus agalactiae]
MALIDIIEKQLDDTQRKISDLDDAYHHSCCQFEEKLDDLSVRKNKIINMLQETYDAVEYDLRYSNDSSDMMTLNRILDSYHDDLEQAYHKEYYALSAQEEEYRANYIRQRSEHELTFEELQREKKRELMK